MNKISVKHLNASMLKISDPWSLQVNFLRHIDRHFQQGRKEN